MQKAAVVLSVLRERGRRGLSCTQLYRQMFNEDLYLLAYGGIYANQGAMTPGASTETTGAGTCSVWGVGAAAWLFLFFSGSVIFEA